MGLDEPFGRIWNQVPDLEVSERPVYGCSYSRDFGAWVDELVKGIREPNVVLVNQAKILLLDKYFEWRRHVPSVHRLRFGLRGHACIFQVFESGYGRLKNLELSLTPPLLFFPEKVPPIIGGIFLGEDLDKPDEEKKDEDKKGDGK